MLSTIMARVPWLKERNITLPIFIRRTHRIVAALWILSLIVTAAGAELPGPSIPGLSFIATILTGSYLLLRPWIRGGSTVSDRLRRLKEWDMTRSAAIRRTHRMVAAPLLLFIALALTIEATGGSETPLVIVPIVGMLLFLSVTGGYMLLRPWVARLRAG